MYVLIRVKLLVRVVYNVKRRKRIMEETYFNVLKYGPRTWHVILIIITLASPGHFLPHDHKFYITPRNYILSAYHPDNSHHENLERNGPIQFPENVDEDYVDNRYNIVTLDTKGKNAAEEHPYPKIARKRKFTVAGRFPKRANEEIPELYEALADHGEKVLMHPPEELKNYKRPTNKQLLKKNYAFSYKVLDRSTGDDFSHSQSTDARATNGEYRVKLPDGRVQIVSYVADDEGYKADVKYEEDKHTQHNIIPTKFAALPQSRVIPSNSHNVDIQRIPVRELMPIPQPAVGNYEYSDDVGANLEQQIVSPLKDPNLVVLERIGPTQIPVNYVDVGVTPTPAYLASAGHELQQLANIHPKVQIITSNARDHLGGNYIAASRAPQIENYYQRHTSTPMHLRPHVVNSGNLGLFVPTTAASYILTDIQGNVVNKIDVIPASAVPRNAQYGAVASTRESLLVRH